MMTRRDMLGLIGVAAGGVAFAPLLPGDGMQGVRRMGLQLYTVRHLLAADVGGTLDAVASAGYAEVETAGYAGMKPSRFARELRSRGLVAPSAHVSWNSIVTAPQELIEVAALMGHEYLVLAWLDERQRKNLEDYHVVADHLNSFGEQCSAAGIQLAYHNHDFEFSSVDDTLPYDVLLEHCDPELVKFEIDFFWVAKAGMDILDLLESHPGRFPMCHVKDMAADGSMVVVGDGVLDFAMLFRAGNTAGFRHYFVEFDDPPDPLLAIRRSAKALGSVRF